MTSHAFLIARTEALLIAEPSVDSFRLRDADLPGLKQLFVDAYAEEGHTGFATVAAATERIDSLLNGDLGRPWAEAWLGIFDGDGPPVAAIVCTRWRGMPFIANVITTPHYRGRGYGSSLIREVAELAAHGGDSAVAITVQRDSPSLRLMLELGFEELMSPVGV